MQEPHKKIQQNQYQMSSKKQKKNSINKGHYLELMDRLHVQTCMIDDHLVSHPLTKKIKKAKIRFDEKFRRNYRTFGVHS